MVFSEGDMNVHNLEMRSIWALLFTDVLVGWWLKSPLSGLMFQIGAGCLRASQFVISIINIQTSSITITLKEFGV
jgi:hypothetical protein